MSSIITLSVILQDEALRVHAGGVQDVRDLLDDLRTLELRAERLTAMLSGGSCG